VAETWHEEEDDPVVVLVEGNAVDEDEVVETLLAVVEALLLDEDEEEVVEPGVEVGGGFAWHHLHSMQSVEKIVTVAEVAALNEEK